MFLGRKGVLPVKILQVIGNGRIGGGTTHVLNLCRFLSEHAGTEVQLLIDLASPAAEEARRMGIPLYEAPFFAGRFNREARNILHEVVSRGQFDILHAHGARVGLPLASMRRRRRLPVRSHFVYSVHGFHYQPKPVGVRHLARLAERHCIAQAERVVFCCDHDYQEALSRQFITDDDPRGWIIEHGVDRRFLLPSIADADTRLIGYAGRLEDEKNPQMLFRILKSLASDGYRLLVIGDGDLAPELHSLAVSEGLADLIDWTGPLPRLEALALLRRVSVFVLPSRWEGLSVIPIEAMLMGIPVVASSVSGLPELIDHGRTGFLCPPGDHAAFINAIRRLHEFPGLREEVSLAALQMAEQRYSLRRCMQDHLSLYRSLLEPPPSR